MCKLESRPTRLFLVLSSFLLGIALGLTPTSTAGAQGASGDTIDGSSCRDSACVEFITCTNYGGSDPWGTTDLVWQSVDVLPHEPATRSKLVWQEASGEFQPFRFIAYWKSGSTSTTSEYVDIGSAGTETGTNSHPNIRYHTSTVTLCDGYTPDGPSQHTSSHNGNTCIDWVRYTFDVRRYKDGDTEKCWVGSQGYATSENSNLDAVDENSCGTAATPYTYATQKNQNLYCRFSTYLVRYSAP
ncbi:MAG: hypothetical protein H6648_05560 [Caldilineae bacterium]|nr:hypothetical protein [Caldilineae bacterium]